MPVKPPLTEDTQASVEARQQIVFFHGTADYSTRHSPLKAQQCLRGKTRGSLMIIGRVLHLLVSETISRVAQLVNAVPLLYESVGRAENASTVSTPACGRSREAHNNRQMNAELPEAADTWLQPYQQEPRCWRHSAKRSLFLRSVSQL